MSELQQYIQSYFPVSKEDLDSIAAAFKETTLEKDDFFLREGQYCDRIAFIRSGLIRIYRLTEDGREVTQWISTPGYFVTDLASFVFDAPGRWNIQALSDCSLFSIDRASYHAIAKSVPKWPELDKHFIARCFILLEERVFRHLHLSAEDRYRELMEQNPELFNQVPLQYLASMMGMTPETLSRLRKKSISIRS
jgi:CRP-like cAMP-binding protein